MVCSEYKGYSMGVAACVQYFYHIETHTLSYIVYDHPGGCAVVIDPVLDFSARSGRMWTDFADQLLEFLRSHHLRLEWILETHAHADHLTAAQYLKQQYGGRVAIGEDIIQVQDTFKKLLNISDTELSSDGRVFDHLFQDQETFGFGKLQGLVMNTPGHTRDSVTYLIDHNAFVGDTLFMPDAGTARCDFPGGDAKLLYDSVVNLHSLPESTKLWMCHDYQPEGRDLRFVTEVAESRQKNIHINTQITQEQYVSARQARDKTLDVPVLLYPSLQINIRAGRLPDIEANQQRYFKIPLSASWDNG